MPKKTVDFTGTVYQRNGKWYIGLRDSDQVLPFDTHQVTFPRKRERPLVALEWNIERPRETKYQEKVPG